MTAVAATFGIAKRIRLKHSRNMRVGTIIGFQNPAAWRQNWTELYVGTLAFASRADELGFDEVWLTEHHFSEDGYSSALMPIAAAIAVRTRSVRIGTKVLLMPFHNPVRLAEDAAVVDIISNGRLDLGIAAGYRREEFAGFGIAREERAARTREGLQVLELALKNAPFTFEGRFGSYHNVRVMPPAIQQPIPIWVGGRSPGPIRRAAVAGYHLQLADFDLDLCALDYAVYTEALKACGRDVADYHVAAVASVFVDEDPQRARTLAEPHMQYQQQQYQRWFADAGDRVSKPVAPTEGTPGVLPGCLVGTPEDVLEQILVARRQVPFTHFSFWMLLPGLSPATATASLELFAERVLPGLQAASPSTRLETNVRV
jgi:alkanesulfonate monooxygenase SsuD/methylene tetrahydromethanopterin reductase-like flavin-dependent oxidoreductase (luciferase family)